MKPIGYHVILRLFDDRVIASTVASRRAVARVMLRHGASYGVVVFRVVDTHLHFIVLCDARACGKLIRAITGALQRQLGLGVPFQTARRKPIVDQQHLYAAYRYILDQERHHGVDTDPWHDGSSLPEMIGFRAIDTSLAAASRRHLPRIQTAELHGFIGGLLDEALADPAQLADAAAAAFALDHLATRKPQAVAARRAAVHVAASLPTRELCRLLSSSARTIERMRHEPVPTEQRRAVELQLRLRSAIAARARHPIQPRATALPQSAHHN